MELPSRSIDATNYTGLIETLVTMSIKLEFLRQSLDPIDDAKTAEVISQIRNGAAKAAAFAQIEPMEWERVNDRLIAALMNVTE